MLVGGCFFLRQIGLRAVTIQRHTTTISLSLLLSSLERRVLILQKRASLGLVVWWKLNKTSQVRLRLRSGSSECLRCISMRTGIEPMRAITCTFVPTWTWLVAPSQAREKALVQENTRNGSHSCSRVNTMLDALHRTSCLLLALLLRKLLTTVACALAIIDDCRHTPCQSN